MKNKPIELYSIIKTTKDFFEYMGYNIVSNNKLKDKLLSCDKKCTMYEYIQENIIYLNNKYIIIPYKEDTCPIIDNIKEKLEDKLCICIDITSKFDIIKKTLKINKNILKIIISYILSQIDFKREEKKKIKEQEEILNSTLSKILVIENPYIKEDIPSSLKEKYKILYSRLLPIKTSLDYSNNYPEKINQINIKASIGSIYYYHYVVEKIVIINPKSCFFNIDKYLYNLPTNIKNKIILINNGKNYFVS